MADVVRDVNYYGRGTQWAFSVLGLLQMLPLDVSWFSVSVNLVSGRRFLSRPLPWVFKVQHLQQGALSSVSCRYEHLVETVQQYIVSVRKFLAPHPL